MWTALCVSLRTKQICWIYFLPHQIFKNTDYLKYFKICIVYLHPCFLSNSLLLPHFLLVHYCVSWCTTTTNCVSLSTDIWNSMNLSSGRCIVGHPGGLWVKCQTWTVTSPVCVQSGTFSSFLSPHFLWPLYCQLSNEDIKSPENNLNKRTCYSSCTYKKSTGYK